MGDMADMIVANILDPAEYEPEDDYDGPSVHEQVEHFLTLGHHELVHLCREVVFGATEFANKTRGIIGYYYKYKTLSHSQRVSLCMYLVTKEYVRERREYKKKWDVPF